MKNFLSTCSLLILCSLPAMAQSAFVGSWQGGVSFSGMELKMGISIAASGDSLVGTIDIPLQQAKGLPLRNVRASGDSITFELPAGPGVALFGGKLQGDSIAGSFRQGGTGGSFHLRRGALEPEKVEAPVPVPYRQEEITFRNGVETLAGTLTIPEGKGPFPAVVLISGSGPQDRDEQILDFKPFRIIADHLTRNGIAVLRYDDRGVGGSSGSVASSTTDDFAGDVLAAVELLKNRGDIDRKQIGLLGHSEGGIVAPIAATRSNDISFLILLAGSGVRGEELLYAQGRAIAKAAGATEMQIEEQTKVQRRIFSALHRNQLDSLKNVMMTEARQQPGFTAEMESITAATLDRQFADVVTPWFRYFIAHDPAPVLRQVRIPVLMIFGELDVQVPAELNRVAMEDALRAGGNRRFRTVILPKANHLFIEGKTGALSEYVTAKKEFVPGLLDTITEFIRRK